MPTPAEDGTQVSGNTTTVDPTLNTSTAPVTGTTTQPDYKALATEWETRAKGWQVKFQAEQTERTNTQKALEALQAEHKTTADQFAGLQTQYNDLQPKYQTMEQNLARLTMLTTEFPDLLPFIKDGQDLLPQGQGEDLRTKLSAFKERLNLAQTNQAQIEAEKKKKESEGALPPPPNGEATAKDLLAQAMQAAQAGKTDEYNKLMDQYLAKK